MAAFADELVALPKIGSDVPLSAVSICSSVRALAGSTRSPHRRGRARVGGMTAASLQVFCDENDDDGRSETTDESYGRGVVHLIRPHLSGRFSQAPAVTAQMRIGASRGMRGPLRDTPILVRYSEQFCGRKTTWQRPVSSTGTSWEFYPQRVGSS